MLHDLFYHLTSGSNKKKEKTTTQKHIHYKQNCDFVQLYLVHLFWCCVGFSFSFLSTATVERLARHMTESRDNLSLHNRALIPEHSFLYTIVRKETARSLYKIDLLRVTHNMVDCSWTKRQNVLPWQREPDSCIVLLLFLCSFSLLNYNMLIFSETA